MTRGCRRDGERRRHARLGFAIAAGLILGAALAAPPRPPDRAAAALTAFGGGVLLAAVALELVPEADREAGPALTAIGLLGATVLADASGELVGPHRRVPAAPSSRCCRSRSCRTPSAR